MMIKALIAILLFYSGLLNAAEPLSGLQPLAWKNRIILINAQNNPQISGWVQSFKENQAEIDERHIYWFALGSRVQTNYPMTLSEDFTQNLLNRYPFGSDFVLLVGKDGEVKERSQDLDLTFLYQQIDQMPMRKMEMLEQKH